MCCALPNADCYCRLLLGGQLTFGQHVICYGETDRLPPQGSLRPSTTPQQNNPRLNFFSVFGHRPRPTGDRGAAGGPFPLPLGPLGTFGPAGDSGRRGYVQIPSHKANHICRPHCNMHHNGTPSLLSERHNAARNTRTCGLMTRHAPPVMTRK